MAENPANKTSATRINAMERAEHALSLRRGGASFRQIGKALGVTEQRAHQIVTKALARYGNELRELTQDVITLELQRLDAMYLPVYQRASQLPPNDADEAARWSPDYEAIKAALDIAARRAKLLGLDKIAFDPETLPVVFQIGIGEQQQDRAEVYTPEEAARLSGVDPEVLTQVHAGTEPGQTNGPRE